MTHDLSRFRTAQANPHAGFAAALRELQSGRKTGHWIWWIFPQLAGLGRSDIAVRYGLAGPEEAADYLRDPELGERLVAAAAAVRANLGSSPMARLEVVMGSTIDTLKLISCMTLFAHVARNLSATEGRPTFATMAEHGAAILAAAAAQGHGPCIFTEQALAASGGSDHKNLGPR